MEKKKALLLVTGGRGAPDFAAFECVQPELVVILTTHEGWKEEQHFRLMLQALQDQEQTPSTIKVAAYSFEETEKQCLKIFDDYPSTIWDWTFSIGSCPKIMGIAAYEIAKRKEIPCLYMDTQHERIISLVKDVGASARDFFNMDVRTYMSIYGRELYIPDSELGYRAKAETWGDIAELLALSPETSAFIKLVRGKAARTPVHNFPHSLAASTLVQELERYKAIQLTQQKDGTISCEITSTHFVKFIQGGWLEIYTWQEAKKTGITNDCQWGYCIKSTAMNELDVAFTYRAQLILVECKTDGHPFTTNYLDIVSGKADMLGRNYVTKIFVTNGSKMLSNYKNFKEQARLRGIVVATAEDLPTLKDLLEKQAKNPDYPRG